MAENCFQQVSALDLAPKGSWPGFGLKRPSWSWSGRKYRGMLTTSNRLYFEILQRRDKKNHEHCFGGWLSSPPFSGIYYIIYIYYIHIVYIYIYILYYIIYTCIRYSWHFLTLTTYSSKLPALAGLGFYVPQNGGDLFRSLSERVKPHGFSHHFLGM